MNEQLQLPPFRMLGATAGLVSEVEIEQLIAEHASLVTQGKLGAGHEDAGTRRSQIVFLNAERKYEWLFQRIWDAAVQFNDRFLGVDVTGIEGNIQLARYDSSDQGFYDWHMDFGRLAPNRKISISVQLSHSEDYEGGDLECFFDRAAYKTDRERGTLICFPSFVMHRVTPVTRGTRWSLVAWIAGARWR